MSNDKCTFKVQTSSFSYSALSAPDVGRHGPPFLPDAMNSTNSNAACQCCDSPWTADVGVGLLLTEDCRAYSISSVAETRDRALITVHG